MFHVNGLHFNNIRGDIYGGLTAAVVALPLAMAMGVASGVGAVAGMYGAIFVGLFSAIFGGTPAQVSGPTGPMTVVMAAIFIQYTGMFPDDPAKGAALAFTVVMLGGIFQILFGLLKLGKYIELVPLPVISGFMSGIGVIIILLQLGPLLGQAAASKPLVAALALPDYIAHYDLNSLTLAAITLTVVYGVPRLLPGVNKLAPSPLLALIIGTLSYLIFMPHGSTPIIGEIPSGFPELHYPVLDTEILLTMIASGLTLAGLGAIDSLLTSLVADNITRTQHKSDRELIGQGIGNTIAGLFGGIPGAGATMRTVANVKAGGKTPISGALHAVILLLIVLGAGPIAADIPKAVLAGILIKVGTDIIDWNYLKRIRTSPMAGNIIMVSVLTITVTIDLLLAVGVGMVMASFIFMQRMADIQKANIRTITRPGDNAVNLTDAENQILQNADEQILLFHLRGHMSFSSAKSLTRRHAEAAAYKVMLLDMTEVPAIDFTTARVIETIITDTLNADREIYIVGLTDSVRNMLERQGVLKYLQQSHVIQQRLDALIEARRKITTNII